MITNDFEPSFSVNSNSSPRITFVCIISFEGDAVESTYCPIERGGFSSQNDLGHQSQRQRYGSIDHT